MEANEVKKVGAEVQVELEKDVNIKANQKLDAKCKNTRDASVDGNKENLDDGINTDAKRNDDVDSEFSDEGGANVDDGPDDEMKLGGDLGFDIGGHIDTETEPGNGVDGNLDINYHLVDQDLGSLDSSKRNTSIHIRIELDPQVDYRGQTQITGVIATNSKRRVGGRSSTSQEAQRENKQKDASEAAKGKHDKTKVGVRSEEGTRDR